MLRNSAILWLKGQVNIKVWLDFDNELFGNFEEIFLTAKFSILFLEIFALSSYSLIQTSCMLLAASGTFYNRCQILNQFSNPSLHESHLVRVISLMVGQAYVIRKSDNLRKSIERPHSTVFFDQGGMNDIHIILFPYLLEKRMLYPLHYPLLWFPVK